MSTFESYLDIRHPSRFSVATLKSGMRPILTDEGGNGMLLAGADAYVVGNMECAAEFLSLLRLGEIDIGSQQRVSKLLLELHGLVKSNKRYHPLAAELHNTLSILGDRVGDFMIARGNQLEVDSDSASEAFGFGGAAGLIHYGLAVARQAAHCSFVSAFCRKLASQSSPTDACGYWTLLVREPSDQEFAKSYCGAFGTTAHAKIAKGDAPSTWEIEFLDFPPFLNWYSLTGAAYQAAAPVLARILEAKVSAVGHLSD